VICFSGSFGGINFLYLPIIYCKFKILGFIHWNNSRPIGNSKYLNLADMVIIQNFAYLYIIILVWFLRSNNFENLKNFLRILRESCILTLCRKHNKSKVWVNSVYTTKILLIRNLFNSNTYFFYFHSINLSALSRYLILIDESFFLSVW
jgi:hypothetical protein